MNTLTSALNHMTQIMNKCRKEEQGRQEADGWDMNCLWMGAVGTWPLSEWYPISPWRPVVLLYCLSHRSTGRISEREVIYFQPLLKDHLYSVINQFNCTDTIRREPNLDWIDLNNDSIVFCRAALQLKLMHFVIDEYLLHFPDCFCEAALNGSVLKHWNHQSSGLKGALERLCPSLNHKCVSDRRLRICHHTLTHKHT